MGIPLKKKNVSMKVFFFFSFFVGGGGDWNLGILQFIGEVGRDAIGGDHKPFSKLLNSNIPLSPVPMPVPPPCSYACAFTVVQSEACRVCMYSTFSIIIGDHLSS